MPARLEQNQRLWRSYGPSLPTVLALDGVKPTKMLLLPKKKNSIKLERDKAWQHSKVCCLT